MPDKSFSFSVVALAKGLNTVGREVEKLGRTLEDLNRKRAEPTIDVDTRKADEKVGAFARSLQTRIERAVRSLPDIKLGADASAADRRIQEIRRQLAELSDKRVGIGVDSTAANAQINRLSSELARLSRQSANVQVRADTAKAAADLQGVSALARRVNGQRVAISVNASDVSRAISLLGLLTAGLAGASALVAPAAASIAALGPLAAAGAQGIGAVAVGFSGVGDAVKALQAEETKGAAGTAVSAASRVNSAQAIVAAQRGVERAQQQADRAGITGGQQVTDARRAVADAYEQGARRVAAASESLTQAQQAERDAQQALNLARADAIEQLQQLGFSVEEADIAQQRATLRLNEARAALNASTDAPDSDAYKSLALDVKDAELAVRETADRYSDLQKQSAQAAKTGVDGTDGVIAAQRRAIGATQDVRDAEAQLAQARDESAKQVADAQLQVQRAVQQSAWAQSDAAASVADSQRALSNAYADTGTQGQTAANKVAEAMAGIGPEAQHFARFLSSEVIPGLHGVRDAVQASLLPRMETALRTIGGLAPVVSAGLSDTGRVIGDLSVKGAQMMTSGPWRADFATIMASNNRSLSSFGNAGLSLADAFRSITAVAGPMVERFARFAASASQAFDSFITGQRASGELDRWFAQMSDTLSELGHVVGQIITGILDLSQAMGPLGLILLQQVGNLVEWIGDLAAANPTLTTLIGSVVIGAAAFSKLGTAVAGVVALRGTVASGWTSIGNAISAIAPSSVATRLGGLQRGMESAALSAGTLTESFIRKASIVENSAEVDRRAAAAGEKVASAGAKVSSVAVKIGSALPIVGVAVVGLGLAYDGLTISADEAADALLKGGAAAQQAEEKLKNQNQAVGSWIQQVAMAVPALAATGAAVKYLNDRFGFLAAGVDDANAAMQRQFNAMTPLQQAQVRSTQAANAYTDAVKAHGVNSFQAINASAQYAAATDKVEQEQRQADEATRSLTDSLIIQRNEMLGSVNADLQAQSSKLAVERAQRSYNDAVTQSGVGSLEAREAENQYQQALAASVAAAGEAARAQNAHKDATTQDRAALQAQNDEIWRLVNLAGGNAPPALLGMAAGMSDADLKARGATVSVDALGHRIVALPGGPGQPPFTVTIDAYTGPADRALNQWIASVNGKQVTVVANMMTPQGVPIRALGGGAVGAVVDPMARGGIRTMSNRIAQAVPPNTPRLIGDRIRGREYFLPDDNAPRTMAIGSQWARDRGMRLMPMASGGALGSATSVSALGATVGGDMFGPLTKSAEDLAATGLKPLADELTTTTVPALLGLQQHAQQDTPNALKLLTQATVDTGQQIQTTWATDTAAVTTAQLQQTGQYQVLGTNLANTTAWMTRSVADLAAQHNASWADMRARSGAEIGTITGPIFGGLHSGMDLVQGHSANMADWVGGQYARIRGLTADPIRWSLDFPINRGLVPAWGAIDKFFALGRPMGPVPIGFAAGTEDHRAQIARPGQMRVWNEPETHGEAYIPLAQAKRGRSTTILGAVADEFGYALEPKFYADGGLWRQMFGIVKGQFPAATLNSAYRAGDPGYHGSGRATDLGGPMAAINQWIAGKFANSTELIHTPGINLWHGAPHTYNAATREEHRNHVHWAEENAAMLGAQAAAGAMAAPDVRGMIEPYFNDTRRMIGDIARFHGPGNVPAAMTRMGNDAVAGAVGKATELMATSVGPGGGAGVERWRPVGLRALAIAGQSASEWPRMAMQMQTESGGNQFAVNNYDINAQRGYPSTGLMQVIRPTYQAHKHPQFDNPPYMNGVSVNPLSNILASTRYTLAAYHTLAAGWKGHGYDLGGILHSGRFGLNTSGQPERVLSPAQTAAFERLVGVLDTVRGTALQAFNLPDLTAATAGVKAAVEKHFHLTVYNAANSSTDLQAQFHRLELMSGV